MRLGQGQAPPASTRASRSGSQSDNQQVAHRHFRDDARVVARERAAGRVNGHGVASKDTAAVDGVRVVAGHRVVEAERVRAGAEPNIELPRRERHTSDEE